MKRDILYVDDESTNLVVFEAAFEDHFNVHLATSAGEALAILETTPLPAVVADQRMPEMTGVELFSIIREKHPHTRRIILTGFADSEAIIDAINKGQVFQFVRKPWQRVELLSVLQQAIDAHDMALQNSVLTERLLVSERMALLGLATARVAHEMSNQLNILPLLELIEEDYADDDQLKQLAEIARSTYQRLAELVNEVKTFVRFDTQGFVLKPTSLAACVHELVTFLRFNSAVPVGSLHTHVLSEPVVLGNKLKLHQVLVNLVRNAADAIVGKSEGRIDVTVDTAGNHALLAVADNGCGIEPAIMSRIWEPFFTTKGDAGNGMGLDITRRMIEAHGGTITCESTRGTGTTFTIRLPLAAAGSLAAK